MPKEWIPEIMYEEDSVLPFVETPEGKEMPEKILIWEFHRTGRFEPGPEGEELPVCESDLHIYFNYNAAKKLLDASTLDKVRTAFGLEPLKEAAIKGQKIINSVAENLGAEKE